MVDNCMEQAEVVCPRLRRHPHVRSAHYAECSALSGQGVDALFNDALHHRLNGPCLWPELCAEQRLCFALGVLIEQAIGGIEVPLDVLPRVVAQLAALQNGSLWHQSMVHARFVASSLKRSRRDDGGGDKNGSRCSVQ